ncbi:FAD-binding oxidoreductase [Streptomyces triticirhizae]|uniref:FAD-binding oxidoreductase n=1 Tax=Streptomyces triticirhizae TaxID=2483353 RepID=A0A3M2LMI0_9ACTN|nr:FAD-binding oxidoreductase [Streptomyces triticirhizae]RMI38647.1 FAD-binding oxidoreductase [Streptomyces triticirhizae]
MPEHAGTNRRRFLTGAGAAAVALGGGAVVLNQAGAAGPSGRGGPRPTATPAVTVTPDDPRYADLVTGMNQRWSATPEGVHLVTTTEQVVRAVDEAVQAGRRISVRSGGHCYEDFVYHADAQAVIDLSAMNRISYDAEMRAFAVEPGATMLDVYETLYKTWGVTIPGGTTAGVGVGGLVPGGGYGLLARRDGLTADHLHAVEVVTVDADGTVAAHIATREADDDNHELWWAHTGAGGGNFGIVTRFWFRTPGATGTDPTRLLPRPPATVLLSNAGLPWSAVTEDSFARLLDNFGAYFEEHQTAGTTEGDLFSFLLLNHVSAGAIGVATQLDAAAPDARAVLDDYLAAVLDGVAPADSMPPPAELPWLRATTFVATSGIVSDPTLRAEHKSAYLKRRLPAEQVAATYRHLTDAEFTNPNAMLCVYSYGARVNEVAADATATSQRASVLKLLYQSFWHDPAEDEANIGWLRAFYADVYAATGGVPAPDDLHEGCYINYPDADLSDDALNTSPTPWHELYFQQNYSRLQQVKADWDPGDVFRHRQSVRLPGS